MAQPSPAQGSCRKVAERRAEAGDRRQGPGGVQHAVHHPPTRRQCHRGGQRAWATGDAGDAKGWLRRWAEHG